MMDTQLVNANGTPVPVGTHLPDSRGGELWVVTGWEAPHHSGSSGRVNVERPCGHTETDHERLYWCNGTERMQFFPHVFGLTVVDV